MEIFLGNRAVRQLRLSASDAIDDGDTETLREDLIEAFSDDQVDAIEQRIDSGDIFEFISEILDQWSGEDVEELFELLETEFSDADIALYFRSDPDAEDDDDEEDEEEEEDDDDVDIAEDDGDADIDEDDPEEEEEAEEEDEEEPVDDDDD